MSGLRLSKGARTNCYFFAAMRRAQRRILLDAIREAGGNLGTAALRLGIHRNTLTRLLEGVGLTGAQVKAWIRQDIVPGKVAA